MIGDFDPKRDRVGFTVKAKGLGDCVQFTSLPENYYHAHGRKLVFVVSRSSPMALEVFKDNPYIEFAHDTEPTSVPFYIYELWNFPVKLDWPSPPNGRECFKTNAEVWYTWFGIEKPVLIRPRLYVYEDLQDERMVGDEPKKILFHPFGVSHGALPYHVQEHVRNRYDKTYRMHQIGKEDDPHVAGLTKIKTPTIRDLAKVIAECDTLICQDSGPSWIAACYPRVRIKKVRTKFQRGFEATENWTPLHGQNPHSWWDDRIFEMFWTGENDTGIFQSYRRI